MATESLPLAPPVAERPGPIGWARRNLFATPFDIALTALIALLLVWVVPPLLRWGALNADFTATSREACPADGACWGIVRDRFANFAEGDIIESYEIEKVAQEL